MSPATRTAARQVVARMRELLATPEAWTRGFLALTATGDTPAGALDPEACSWCILGAARRACAERLRDTQDADGDNRDEVSRAVRYGVSFVPRGGPATFNDDPRTTHADVLTALARADWFLAEVRR